jgi:hypothetical protein
MSKYNRYVKHVLGLSLLVLLFSGCATLEKESAMDTERTLAMAGFRMKTADTPKQRANLQALTQHKLMRHEKDGKPVWVYADAAYCNCVYVGNEKAYQEYLNLTIKQGVALENTDAAMDWDEWGSSWW